MAVESEKNQTENKLSKGDDCFTDSNNGQNDTNACVQIILGNGLTHKAMDVNKNVDVCANEQMVVDNCLAQQNTIDVNVCLEASNVTHNNAFGACGNGEMISILGPQDFSQKGAAVKASDSSQHVFNASSAYVNCPSISDQNLETRVRKADWLRAAENTRNAAFTSGKYEEEQRIADRGVGIEPPKIFGITDYSEANNSTKTVVSTLVACDNGLMTLKRSLNSKSYEVIQMVECSQASSIPWNATDTFDGIRQIRSEQRLDTATRKPINNGTKKDMIETSAETLPHDAGHSAEGAKVCEISDKTPGITAANNAYQSEADWNQGNHCSFVIKSENNPGNSSVELGEIPEKQLQIRGGNPGYEFFGNGQAEVWTECAQSCKRIVMDSCQSPLMNTGTDSLINSTMQGSINDMHKIAQNISVFRPLVAICSQESVNQEPCETALVSTDIAGWQRFDTEYTSAQIPYVAGGHPQQGQELWEQLLEGALETNANDSDLSVFPQAPTFPLNEGNQLWLASPGNPFIESVDRTSNFSEAEGFAIPSFKNALMNAEKESFQNSSASMGFLSASESYANTEEKLHLQSMPEVPRPSLDIRAAPSFTNVADPESLALFKAATPTPNATNDVCGHGAWEANFDTFVPVNGSDTFVSTTQNATPQGVPRSSSLPRLIDRLHGEQGVHYEQEGHRWSFSVASDELATPSLAPSEKQKIRSLHAALGFMSPRISPLVKKVVKSIQTSPVVGKTTPKHRAQNMSSKSSASVMEKPKKPLWARCVCCSKIE